MSSWNWRHVFGSALMPFGGRDLRWRGAVMTALSDALSYGRQFIAGDRTYLQASDSAMLSIEGDQAYRIGLWVYPTSFADYYALLSKGRPANGAGNEYEAYIDQTTGKVYTAIRKADDSAGVSVLTTDTLTLNAWNYIEIEHDPVGDTLGVTINRGTKATSALAGGVYNGTHSLQLGALADWNWLTGRLSRVSIQKGALAQAVIDSAAHKNWEYNSGKGRSPGELETYFAGLGSYASNTDYECWGLASASTVADGELSLSGANDLSRVVVELGTNITFASDASWTKGTGWTIAAGVASSDGSQSADADLTQAMGTTSGNSYTHAFDVTGYSAGKVAPLVGGAEGTDRAANGSYSQTVVASSGGISGVRADLDFVGNVDNVSVKSAGITICLGPGRS